MIRHRSIPVPWGVVHARGNSEDRAELVFLHQTPRSGDEFTEVLELCDRPSIALDLPGMGQSTPHPDGDAISAYAHGIIAALAADGIDRFTLVGHHTGAAVAATVAASQSERVVGLVLSSPPWVDEAARTARLARTGPGVDEVVQSNDGAHVAGLWNGRAPFYPADRPDLLDRFVADALLVEDPAAGHRAVTNWQMDAVLPALGSLPVLLVDHVADPYSHPHIAHWAAALPEADVATILTGMVPLEFTAAEFAAVLATLGA